MRPRVLCLAAALLAAPALPRAEGLYLGAEAGGARPLGDAASSAPVSGELRYAVPLVFEAGYVFQAPVSAGLFVQYAPGPINARAPVGSAACADIGASCSRGVWKALGLRADLLLEPVAGLRPRLGVSMGYEWLGYGLRDASGPGSLSWKGPQAGLRLAADLRVAGPLLLGPSFDVTLGRFDSLSVQQGGQSASGTLGEKRVHVWLGLGFQARLEL